MASCRQFRDGDPDKELLQAAMNAREGDLRAFEQLVAIHRKRIVADCLYLTRDKFNAEDLAQEVFVKAFCRLREFHGRSTFRHWLRSIEVHHCLNHLKKRGRRDELSLEHAVSLECKELRVTPDAGSHLQSMETRARIEMILRAMPATLRVPLVMRDINESSYQDIATTLQVSLSAVKMRIKRGREHFRQLYQSAPFTEGF